MFIYELFLSFKFLNEDKKQKLEKLEMKMECCSLGLSGSYVTPYSHAPPLPDNWRKSSEDNTKTQGEQRKEIWLIKG